MSLSALFLAALIAGQLPSLAAPVSEDPLNTLALAEAQNCAAQDDGCRQTEFRLRYQADQGVRSDNALKRLCFSPGASGFDDVCAESLWTSVDMLNTKAAKSIIATGEWPGWTGASARALWLIIQHSRTEDGGFDTDFMVEALPFLLEGVRAGGLDPQDYARTADRALLDQGELQKFGTIRVCRDGAFDMATISSESAVDAERRNLGMNISFADLKRFMDTQCQKDLTL